MLTLDTKIVVEEQKHRCSEIDNSLLQSSQERNQFMECTLTCGTTWSHHFAPRNRLEYKENNPTPSRGKKLKGCRFAGKVVISEFCATEGVTQIEFMPRNTTLTAKSCAVCTRKCTERDLGKFRVV